MRGRARWGWGEWAGNVTPCHPHRYHTYHLHPRRVPLVSEPPKFWSIVSLYIFFLLIDKNYWTKGPGAPPRGGDGYGNDMTTWG